VVALVNPEKKPGGNSKATTGGAPAIGGAAK